MATRYGLYIIEIKLVNGRFNFREVSKHFTDSTNVEIRSLGYLGNSQVLFGFLRDPLLHVYNYEQGYKVGTLRVPLDKNFSFRIFSLHDVEGVGDFPCKHFIL